MYEEKEHNQHKEVSIPGKVFKANPFDYGNWDIKKENKARKTNRKEIREEKVKGANARGALAPGRKMWKDLINQKGHLKRKSFK